VTVVAEETKQPLMMIVVCEQTHAAQPLTRPRGAHESITNEFATGA
jgi:hypothetical protein